MPFRFGVVTLTEAPQAFVRARIRLENGTEAEGAAAELLAPKWFDKNPALSNEDNFEQLRDSMRQARAAYLSGSENTAYGHSRPSVGLVENFGPCAARSCGARRPVPRAGYFVLRCDREETSSGISVPELDMLQLSARA